MEAQAVTVGLVHHSDSQNVGRVRTGGLTHTLIGSSWMPFPETVGRP